MLALDEGDTQTEVGVLVGERFVLTLRRVMRGSAELARAMTTQN